MSVGPANPVVVDASVAVKWLLRDEDNTEPARLLLRRFAQGEVQLIVPAHLRYEVSSAIIAATLGRAPRLGKSDAQEIIAEFLSLPLLAINSDELILSAFTHVHQFGCAFYDALYLALAQILPATLITADRKFYQRVRQLPEIVWVGDYR
ncbi:MAG TPA: type II toxin-antitoxin system VapC family toxin [Chloroflexota bacterium]|nr:type II toxin-antitoxin system VapC family toxin [Chloroflexota bacterium]